MSVCTYNRVNWMPSNVISWRFNGASHAGDCWGGTAILGMRVQQADHPQDCGTHCTTQYHTCLHTQTQKILGWVVDCNEQQNGILTSEERNYLCHMVSKRPTMVPGWTLCKGQWAITVEFHTSCRQTKWEAVEAKCVKTTLVSTAYTCWEGRRTQTNTV